MQITKVIKNIKGKVVNILYTNKSGFGIKELCNIDGVIETYGGTSYSIFSDKKIKIGIVNSGAPGDCILNLNGSASITINGLLFVSINHGFKIKKNDNTLFDINSLTPSYINKGKYYIFDTPLVIK